MKHLGTVTLETERLVLRRFINEDAQPMFNNWASNEKVAKYVTWYPHENVGTTKEIINSWIKQYESDDTYRWAIELKKTNALIGIIDVVGMDSRDTAQIGYCLSESYWGQGVMTEAFKRVIALLFNEVGFHKIEARHIKENIGSGEVMKKCGLKYECTLMHNEKVKGEWRDMCIYSLFKSEYKN